MFKGFYNLASGMITKNRNLNVISNNMTNMNTPGFKSDTMVSTTFQEEVLSRYGNLDRSEPVEVGATTMILTPEETIADFAQGSYEETGHPLDFALAGSGFFVIQAEDGVRYTRNGSFIIDDGGYLSLQGSGRVLGTNGPIHLYSDDVTVNPRGVISIGDIPIATLLISDFEDYALVTKDADGLFQSAAQPINGTAVVMGKTLETSNVDSIREMTEMMSSQRSIQSLSQILKMYDELMAKTVTELGKI